MVMPIGQLMIEHRLIERMIALMHKELSAHENVKKIDPSFIDLTVDFIRTYADRLHHGKEEGILFRDLKKKSISIEHRKAMEDLIEEHEWGRKIVGKLGEANEKYRRGDLESAGVVAQCLNDLADFYPRHIEKEDKHFFIPCMDYFDAEEQQAMLEEEQEFDKSFIHRLYKEKVERMERQKNQP